MTVLAYAQDWLRAQAPHLRPSSRRAYRKALMLLAAPLHQAMLDTMRPRDVLAALRALEAAGYAANTIRCALGVLRAVYATALIEERALSDPTRGLGRDLAAKAYRGEPVPEAHLARLLSSASARIPAPVMDYFRLLALTGLRVGEGLGLRWEDVQWRQRSLMVRRQWADDGTPGPTKNGRSRVVDLPELAMEVLAGLAPDADGWVFRSSRRLAPWSSNYVHYCFRALHAPAGLVAHYTPHQMRHSYAVRLLEGGASLQYVQQQLGHQRIGITIDLYGRFARLARPAVLDEVGALHAVVRPRAR